MELFNDQIDANKYRVFLAVAECKSFSKATEYLHISQPAISHAIKELEDQLNTKLFIRNNKSVELTEDGQRIKFYVKKAFDTILLGEKLLKEESEDLNGVIRIGIYSHISLFMLPKVMKEFNSKYPNAKFNIYSTSNQEMIEKLRNNELDLIVMQYPIFINETKFKEEILCSLDTCFYSNKYHYELIKNNKDIIKEIPMILPMRGFPDINRLEEELKNHNLILKHNFTSYASELTKKLVLEGLGFGWGVKECINNELENELLYELDLGIDTPLATFSIAYNEEFLNKTTKEFIKLFKDKMKDISVK